jgi:hypothetical protein
MYDLTIHTYRIVAEKNKTGAIIEGTCRWDGLADLFLVTSEDGTETWVSSLDRIITRERIA